jgi:para-nitrobenzyl esterase
MQQLLQSAIVSRILQILRASVLVFSFQSVAAQIPLAHIRQGYLHGTTENGIVIFKSVPYAEPPVGALRYLPPVVHRVWQDTLNATEFGASAVQPMGASVTGSEDCLYLNVYTPAIDNGKRPVVIWVHGGSMTGGTGKTMDGHAFADKDGIVTITINYRLGAFGFLYLGDLGQKYCQSGNLGLLDVVAALQWVHENISAFGGDPSRVTVMGESAGAKLLSAVMVTPASKGLFQQAILESGAVQCIRDSVTAKNARALLLRQLGLRPDQVHHLLALPADTLIKAQAKVCAGIGGNSFFGPVYDGLTIPADGYQYARDGKLSGIRVLIGTNEEEGASFVGKKDFGAEPDRFIFQPLFRFNAPLANAYFQIRLRTDSPYVAMVKTLTQYMYQLHSYRFAGALSHGGTPVYMYRYQYQNGREMGARHGDELHYIWGACRIAASGDDPVKKQLARTLHGAWSAFIRTGDPNGDILPHWPRYSVGDKKVMVFDVVDLVMVLKEVYDDNNFPSAVFVIK